MRTIAILGLVLLAACSGGDASQSNAHCRALLHEATSVSASASDVLSISASDVLTVDYGNLYVVTGTTVTVSAEATGDIEVSLQPVGSTPVFAPGSDVTFTATGDYELVARLMQLGTQVGTSLTIGYRVVAELPGVATDGSYDPSNAETAEVISNWASCAAVVNRGLDRSTASGYDDPSSGRSVGDGLYVLGNAGSITYEFADGIRNGPGNDFVVFENGLVNTGGLFAELAFAEVSSDGVLFVRFDSLSRQTTAIPAFAAWPTNLVYGVAGRYPDGSGDGFDLERLKHKALVRSGQVDLDAIRYVRLVDIIGVPEASLLGPSSVGIPRADHSSLISQVLGNYHSQDSFGNQIYDPYATVGTGGFDLDGIGVIHPAAP